MKRPPKFTQADITRALKGVRACGSVPHRIDVDLEGKITIYLVPGDEIDEALDRELAAFKAKHGYGRGAGWEEANAAREAALAVVRKLKRG